MARTRIIRRIVLMGAAGILLTAAACGGGRSSPTSGASATPEPPVATSPITSTSSSTTQESGTVTTTPALQQFPDVVGVEIERLDSGLYRFDVTLSSPYDTPERYADAWRIVGPDGEVYGVRELLHDHANEQPFTRSLSDVEIPEGVSAVTVEGRDLEFGWGGATLEVALPGS